MNAIEQAETVPQPPWRGLRRSLGPLGRYRPSLFRKNMAAGFKSCDGFGWPRWSWLPQWTSAEERLLESLNLHGRVVYDIGAFSGAYSLFFSRKVGVEGAVVAFEPQAAVFDKLSRNLRLNQVANVYALALALGAEAGDRPIYVLPGMATTASLATEACTPVRRRSGAARVEPLDAVLTAMKLPPPHFIKIDVEGMEIEVMRGAAATIQRHRPEMLIEVHGSGRRHKLERVRQLARMLEPLGYELIHTESGRAVREDSRDIAAGHIYARCSRPLALA